MKIRLFNLGIVFLVVTVLLVPFPASAEGEPPLWPLEGFWNEPADPSTFDFITFGLYGYAPPGWVCQWDFGDGSTSNECFAYQAGRYARDGDYTVQVTVTNELGATDTETRVVSVRTHDVTITKFSVPQTASAGQTRPLAVSLRNTRYPETVQVSLYKSTVGDYVLVGQLTQFVPVRAANRTTTFSFNYTFTGEDARNGKVTFKAVAELQGVRDGWMADNVVIALPTRVGK